MRGPGASVLLGRALSAAAARHGCAVSVEEREATAWHSATFSGERLALALSAPAGVAWGGWLATIGDMDVALPGHLLADLCVMHEGERDGRCYARIDALTVAQA
jgi:hypothetical protein